MELKLTNTNPVYSYAIVTLLPVALLLMAIVSGGIWVLSALIYMTAATALLDQALPEFTNADDAENTLRNADILSVILGGAHFVLMLAGLWALTGNLALGVAEIAGLFAALSLFFGQVSNPNAHELIHRSNKTLFRLGKWIYISMLFGHHTSAHLKVHHRFVATDDDPNSARRGESAWRFLRRAWIGSFRAGLKAENRQLIQRDGRLRWLRHPYTEYAMGSIAWLFVAWTIGGGYGVLTYVAISTWAQAQLLLSDYVQHYGLRRAPGSAAEPGHSWNAPNWMSSHLMLNASRHSDHHAAPARPWPALKTDSRTMPVLPASLPAMATLALWPRAWHRIMDPRLDALARAKPEVQPKSTNGECIHDVTA